MPEPPPAALLSLSDTTGAAELAAALHARSVPLLATSGTKDWLQRQGIAAADVAQVTGFPPLFGGRVKTLDPRLFGAILFDRENAEHRHEAKQHGIAAIATVAVTLYAPPEIDIGGVALLRAAAKNYAFVSVLCDPAQYESFLEALERGGPSLDERRTLAAAALRHVAAYDMRNAARLADSKPLRYGENPHELGVFYPASDGVPEQLAGKELSYNNLLDLDATLRLLAREGGGTRAVIVKHTVPCGVAERASAAQAVREALDADRISAYGGIVAIDTTMTTQAAAALSDVFLEIVAAPDFDDGALRILERKRRIRIMRFSRALPRRLLVGRTVRSALGGTLVQEPDPAAPPEELRVVSRRVPSDGEWEDLRFAWDVVAHVKSNAIVIAKDGVTRGICAGQTNRVSAVETAVHRAAEHARQSACASDGYFPFRDGLEAAAAAGCTAVIAPGGSIRDAEVVGAADDAGIALVFSSRRHFLH